MTDSHVVVVLNWRGRVDTLECVASLLDDLDLAVLVVDNGSFDGTIEALPDDARVHALQLPRNLGFSGGMNRGIEWAVAHGADVITVLNNDTLVPAAAMKRIREAVTGTRVVSPVVSYRDRPDEVWFAGGSIDTDLGYAYHTPARALTPCDDGLRQTEVLAGCCITARATTWRDVGLFDERFFLNFEDSEWSLRARRRGVELAVVCDAKILHAVSASFRGEAATLGTFYFIRNGMLFSRLSGARSVARLRFLRRFGAAGFREATPRMRLRATVIVGAAVASYLLRIFGEAPSIVRDMAQRWAESSPGGDAVDPAEVGDAEA